MVVGRAEVKIVCAVLCLFVASGCRSVGELPQPGSPAPAEPVTASAAMGLTERFVEQTIFDMRDLMMSGNITGFMQKVSNGFYRGYARLEDNLRETLKDGGRISLEVTIGAITVEEGKVTAEIDWESSRAVSDDEVEKDRGKSVLIFRKGNTISLLDFRKDVPFGIKGF